MISRVPGWILEVGLMAGMVFGVVFFGAVYPWVSMTLYALLFFLFFIYPRALFSFFDFPKVFRFGISLTFLFVLYQYGFASLNRYQTGEELLKWLALAAAMLLTQLLSYGQSRRLLKFLVILGVLEVLYGSMQLLADPEMILWHPKEAYLGYLTGTFIYRNHLAGFLAICAGVQLGFCAETLWQKSYKKILLHGIIFFILIIGLLKTGSRAGLVSFLCAFLFFFPVCVKKFSNALKIAGAALMGIGVGAACWLERSILFSRLLDLKNDLVIGSGRWLVWQDAVRMLSDYCWTGIGLGGFKWLYPRYQSRELLMGWSHAHNDYLELLVELGLPAFLVLSVAFIGIGVVLLRALSHLETKEYFTLCGILAALFAFLIHGMMDFNWAIPINNLMVILITGLGIRLQQFPEIVRNPP
jgi:O-antigen ligase